MISGRFSPRRTAVAGNLCLFLLATAPLSAQLPDTLPRHWHGQASIGASLLTGTTKVIGGTAAATAQRSFGRSGFQLTGDLDYAEVRSQAGNQIVRNDQLVHALIDHPLSPPFFFATRSSWERDKVKGLDYRLQQLAGIGLQFSPGRNSRVRLIPGVSVLHEEKASIDSGFDAGAGFYQTLNWRLGPVWAINQWAALRRDFDQANDVHFAADIALTGLLFRRLGLRFEYEVDHETILAGGVEQTRHDLTAGLQINF